MNSRQRREGRRVALTQYDELEAIYARLPRIQCKGLCHAACGHIGMTELEALRMNQYDGKEAPTIAPAIKELITGQDGGMCPKLTADGKCSVYPVRPFICRLYGTDHKLECPFGCVPERWTNEIETQIIFEQIKQLSIERYGQPE
jgi:Fe-S-cluster containining protein